MKTMKNEIIITDEELEYFKQFDMDALVKDLTDVVNSIESLGDFDDEEIIFN